MAAALADPPELIAGDLLRLRGGAIADYIRRNHSVMALGEVLKSGVSMRQARRKIDVIEAIAGALEQLDLRIIPGASATEVRAVLRRGGRR